MNRRTLLSMLIAAPVAAKFTFTTGPTQTIRLPAVGPVGSVCTIVKIGPEKWVIMGDQNTLRGIT